MDDQINLFEEIEQKERDEQNREAVRDGYRAWLLAPELTPCGVDATPGDYLTYDGVIHLCDTMPHGVYFWQNEVESIHGGQYWVRGQESDPVGTQMDICPFCGANLCHGEGERFLRKAAGYVFSQVSYRRYYGLDEIDAEVSEGRCAP